MPGRRRVIGCTYPPAAPASDSAFPHFPRLRARVGVGLLVLLLLASSYASALAASGALDPTFGGDGLVTTDIGAFSDEAVQILVESDGMVIARGGCLPRSFPAP